MTDDEADLKLLGLANEKRKFALEVGYLPPAETDDEQIQLALERGMDRDWFTLIDVSPISDFPRRLFRVFRLTDAGMARLNELMHKAKVVS